MWKRVAVGTAIVILAAIGCVIQFGGAAAVKLVTHMLADQQVVDGTLKYEKISAGWSGSVEIKNLQWLAPNGDKQAEVPLLTMSLNLWDTLLKGGGVASISAVTLDKPVFYGLYTSEGGLDLYHNILFVGEEKPSAYKSQKPLEPTQFRGLMEIKDGRLEARINDMPVKIAKFSAQGLFKSYPTVKWSFTAHDEAADMVLNIEKNGKAMKVRGEIKKAEAASLAHLFPSLKDVALKSGRLETANINADRDDQGRWTLSLDGRLQNLKGQAFNFDFAEGSGGFSATRDQIKLDQLVLRVSEVPLSFTGTIKTAAGTPDPPRYELRFSGKDFACKALSGGLDFEGRAEVEGTLTGTSLEPKLEGKFASKSMKAAPLTAENIQGGFSMQAGKLQLQEVIGTCYGGKLRLNGFVELNSRSFNLKLDGLDLDAAKASSGQVGGRLKFSTVFMGSNHPDSAMGTGNFEVADPVYEGTKASYFQGDLNVVKGVFGLQNLKMHKGFKDIVLAAALNADKKVTFKAVSGKINPF